MSHTAKRWSRETIDRLKGRLLSKIVKDKDGCWIFQSPQNDRTPIVSVRPVKDGQMGIHYLSAFIYKGYDINSEFKVLRKCNKSDCCNPKCIEIVDTTNTVS